MRAVLVLFAAASAYAQLSYSSGQSVYPAYEGWEKHADGSIDMIFGYMNSNWEEEFDVPVGAENNVQPGGPDQGQPTHFFPRRNRFVFRVRVPKDFGTKEMVWTLTTHGKTYKAYGTLAQDYFLDNMVFTSETGAIGAGVSSPEIRANKAPVLEAAGDRVRTVKVGETITLSAHVTDDGIPKPRPRGAFLDRARGDDQVKDIRLVPPRQVTVGSATGLWVSLYVYRAAGKVSISPDQPKTWEDTRAGANAQWAPLWQAPPAPSDNKWTVQVKFDQPGEYVLRWHASDGALWADEDIKFTVRR